jgi:predicted PurR-regulated permease PerM
VLTAVVAVIAIGVLVIPPLVGAFVRLAADLPTSADIDQAVANLQTQLGSLPDGSQAVIIPVVTALATAARDTLAGAAGSLDDIVRTGVGALLNAAGALLGLIVLPTWMLVMMNQQRRGRTAVNREITPSLRKDVWAVVAIVDRATGAYLRGYVVTAGLVGLFAWMGLTLSPRVGGPTFANPFPLATFVAVSQVVPVVGPIIALLPGALIATLSPERAVAYVVIYVAARLLGASLLGSRIMSRRMSVHPAILVPGVVMIGQFGLFWLLLSAPIVAIAVDLVRYIHGRFSDPPMPAGVLPREPVPTPVTTTATAPPIPSAYRRGVAPRSIPTTSATAPTAQA